MVLIIYAAIVFHAMSWTFLKRKICRVFCCCFLTFNHPADYKSSSKEKIKTNRL